jgi:glucose-6-phosphate isomerase
MDGASTLVVFGTGGSSLGGQAIAQLGGWSIPGDNGGEGASRARLRFYDNLDARSLYSGLSGLDFARTRFIVISKSGGTAETLAQTLTAFAMIGERGQADLIPRLFLGLTEPDQPGRGNGLRALFRDHGIPMLDHDTEIGGRYSAFTNVGMLPALARGLDAAAIREGGRDVVTALQNAGSPGEFAPAAGAALAVALAQEKGVSISVMMPYCDKLAQFAAWYVQLWAESLGKGGQGTTPLAALGPVDQHSQLQLFLDGPRQHLMTVMRITGRAEDEVPMPAGLAEKAGLPDLGGKTAGDLVRAQQAAIVDAFREQQRPVRTFDLDRLDERNFGALMMHFMLETILAADLLGVDPFDQPAVELGKRITRQYLARA